jgi:hypothetical protein
MAYKIASKGPIHMAYIILIVNSITKIYSWVAGGACDPCPISVGPFFPFFALVASLVFDSFLVFGAFGPVVFSFPFESFLAFFSYKK